MFIESGGNRRRGLLHALRCRFRDAIARWNEAQWRDSREVMARELNVSRAEFDALSALRAGCPESLSRRLLHAGLCEDELAMSHSDVLRDLDRVCRRCPSLVRCARDLKHERRATPAKYCPNEQALRALSREIQQAKSQNLTQILPFPAHRN